MAKKSSSKKKPASCKSGIMDAIKIEYPRAKYAIVEKEPRGQKKTIIIVVFHDNKKDANGSQSFWRSTGMNAFIMTMDELCEHENQGWTIFHSS